MQKQLPSKLNKPPIIEALFEMRFQSDVPTSNILSGIFFTKLGKPVVDRLLQPGIVLPQMREHNPMLSYAPLLRIITENFSLYIGDKVFLVSCSLPYPGWTSFKNIILESVKTV